MLVPNRHGSSNSYRYGFQGQEKDDEIKGEGNSLNYTFRMHDPRVGRFFATDPLEKKFVWQSPYVFAGNNPIQFIDILGAGPGDKCTTCGKAEERKVGDTHTEISKHYQITYEVKIDGDLKYWSIKTSQINDSFYNLTSKDQVNIYSEYLDKTSYAKVAGPPADSFFARLFESRSFAIDPTQSNLLTIGLDILSPFYSDPNIYFEIDDEGFINLGNGVDIQEASLVSFAKALPEAKALWQVYRNRKIIKHGKLSNILARMYKSKDVMEGGTAAVLLKEAQTGKLFSKGGHFVKAEGNRNALLKILRSGELNALEKSIVHQELFKLQTAIEAATSTASKFSGKGSNTLLDRIIQLFSGK